MSSKKKQRPSNGNGSKTSKYSSSLYPVAPPVPPRPAILASKAKLPRKPVLKEQVNFAAQKTHQLVSHKYISGPSNGLYISNSCDNVHKMMKQPYLLNESVYSNGSSHIILGQHIHNERSAKNGIWFLKSSSSVKFSSKPIKHSFIGSSHPEINNFKHFVNLSNNQWIPENSLDHKCLTKEKLDHSNYLYLNGYDYYDQRYLNSYQHKNTVPNYPSRKFSSANSSSSSRSSSKSKASTNFLNNSNANSNSYTNYTFNRSTFRAEDFRYAKSKHVDNANSLLHSSKLTNQSKEVGLSVNTFSSNFSKCFPYSSKMASLHGLPPLPKSLSGVNLQNETPAENSRVQSNTSIHSSPSMSQTSMHNNEGRKGRSLPTPPASLSQNNVTPTNFLSTSTRKPISLDSKLTILRQEMFGLRQLDLSLLSQLWSLNESIQEFRQLQESMSIPSPSDDGEDGDEILYSNLTPVSGRLYRNLCRNGGDSSSSSSSIDFGKV